MILIRTNNSDLRWDGHPTLSRTLGIGNTFAYFEHFTNHCALTVTHYYLDHILVYCNSLLTALVSNKHCTVVNNTISADLMTFFQAAVSSRSDYTVMATLGRPSRCRQGTPPA
jgi:hypothetical protein